MIWLLFLVIAAALGTAWWLRTSDESCSRDQREEGIGPTEEEKVLFGDNSEGEPLDERETTLEEPVNVGGDKA